MTGEGSDEECLLIQSRRHFRGLREGYRQEDGERSELEAQGGWRRIYKNVRAGGDDY